MDQRVRGIAVLFSLSLTIGGVATTLWKNPAQSTSSLGARQTVGILLNEDKLLARKEKELNDLDRAYKKLQKQLDIEQDILSKDDATRYRNMRLFFGMEDITGEGVIIKIASIDENNNPAFELETSRTLLKLLNYGRVMKAEVIAINNQHVTNRSGVILAGNHINVNDIPITPPYEIKFLGNEKKLYRYFTQESVLLLALQKENTVSVSIEQSRKIVIPKSKVTTRFEYLQEIE